MSNTGFVFGVGVTRTKSSHAILFAVAAICVLTLFEGLNSPVKAASLPIGQTFADRVEFSQTIVRQINEGSTSNVQKNVPDRVYQFIELTAAVSPDSQTIANEISSKSAYESEYDVFRNSHCHFLINMFCLFGGLLAGIFLWCITH